MGGNKNRRSDSVEKLLLQVAAALTVVLLSFLAANSWRSVDISERAVKISEKANRNSDKLNVTMKFMRESVEDIKDNQEKLFNKVDGIESRLHDQDTRMTRYAVNLKKGCEQANRYWQDHQRDCGE